MDDHDWASLAPREGTLVINESFTLHHVSDDVDGADGRDAVLARIKSLEPELFVATEPDVDHDTMPRTTAPPSRSASSAARWRTSSAPPTRPAPSATTARTAGSSACARAG
jgi:hypothetical protein